MTKYFRYLTLLLVIPVAIIFAVPYIFTEYLEIKYSWDPEFKEEFPVTVDPANKAIVESVRVNAYLRREHFHSEALTLFSTARLEEIFARFTISVSEMTGASFLALAGSEKVVTISAGLRKEEVANSFAKTLGWNEMEKKIFLSKQAGQSLPMTEGTFSPGVYVVSSNMTPLEVQEMVNTRFTNNVLSRYSTSTREVVPLQTALTIASLIQRETIGTDDMRVVSGIIWNRIFANMNLQLDASLQYVKANSRRNSVWWPEVRPQDKFTRSPYNTYTNKGLPPAPIANPSIAAIVAALNPVKTACIFYFHDDEGDFHCSRTYKEHVALLKQHYGRGK